MGKRNKNPKSIIRVDWTSTDSSTPFYDSALYDGDGGYGVAVDTGVVKYPELLTRYGQTYNTDPTLIQLGSDKILDFYNKASGTGVGRHEWMGGAVAAQIANGAAGTYIPMRPSETIKVFVTIPATKDISTGTESVQWNFDTDVQLKVKPPHIGSYEEVHINTDNLNEYAKNIAQLLRTYNTKASDYDGRVYNFNFEKQATKVENFSSLLYKLIRDNDILLHDEHSELVIIGASDSFTPEYAQISQKEDFLDLFDGFEQFKKSKFVDGNTIFIYKHIDEINSIAIETGAGSPSSTSTSTQLNWEEFLDKYIQYPPALVEHTSDAVHKVKEEKGPDLKPGAAKNANSLSKENEILNDPEIKKKQETKQQRSRKWVGDNVVGNLDTALDKMNSLENIYHETLDKIGMTHIMEAALRCLKLDLTLPGVYDEFKQFIQDIRNFTAQMVGIMKVPTIKLNDLLPTVNIMWDIIKAIVKAIYEAVYKALWQMLKGIIHALLDSCNDPCAASYGGIDMGGLLAKGGLAQLGKGLIGPALTTVGSAAVAGAKTGLGDQNLQDNSTKFLSNLNKKVSPDQLKTLMAPAVPATNQTMAAAKNAWSNSALGKFFEEASATLTCGETRDVLRGKASPAAKEVIKGIVDKSTQDIDCGLPSNKDSAACILKELLKDDDDINDFFGGAGSLIDHDDLDKQIETLGEFFPDSLGCINDKQDSERRAYYLGQRDVPPDVIDEQNNGSRDRAEQRANDLNDFIKDPNTALSDAIPPIYCTYENGKIVDGLVPQDHPSFTFMMKNALDTTFDGVSNAFVYDVLKVPELMKIEVPDGIETIERVVRGRPEQGAQIVDGHYRMINPHFRVAMEQGHKPIPAYWKSEPWTQDNFEDKFSINFEILGYQIGTAGLDLIQWGGLPGASQADSDQPDRQAIYQQNGIIRTIKKNMEMAPLEIPRTKIVYCPGMSPDRTTGKGGVYDEFQTQYTASTGVASNPSSPANVLARRRLKADRMSLQLNIDNLLKENLQQAGLLSTIADEVQRNPSLQASLGPGGLSNMFGPNAYVLSYRSFDGADPGKDKFSIRIVADYSSGEDANIYAKMFQLDISPKASNVIAGRGLVGGAWNTTPASTKEKHFVEFLQTMWTEGESTYTGSVGALERINSPAYSKNYLFNAAGGELVRNALLEDQNITDNIKSLYEELLHDLMSQCLAEVKDSKLLEIENLFSLLNLAPKPCANGIDRSILGFERLKDDIMEQYKNALCIESSSPNVTGLGDNRDNAFESAAIFGIIKATARVYALEMTIKTLPTFSELQVTDLDEVCIAYVRQQIIDEIRAKGYLDEFISQTLKAYNLVAADREDLVSDPLETKFSVALDFFVKEEMSYAVRKLLRVAGLRNLTPPIDNLLIDGNLSSGWLPTIDAGDILSQFAQGGMQRPWFHVDSADDIKGIKDWGNGTLVLEKYIRIKPTARFINTSHVDAREGVFPVDGFALFTQQPPPLPAAELTGSTPAQTIIDSIDVEGDPDCGDGLDSRIELETQIARTGGRYAIPGETGNAPINFSAYFEYIRFGLRLVARTKSNVLKAAMGAGALIGVHTPKAAQNKSYNPGWVIEQFDFPMVGAETQVAGLDARQPMITGDFFARLYEIKRGNLVSMLKETDEYSFLFDYCFPLKRLVSLAVLYNAAYVLPYPGLNDVFTNTKEQLRISFLSMLKSGNYTSSDIHWTPENMAINLANGQLPPGFDFAKMAVQFIVGIFKGAGETFSPNIKIAALIKEAAKKIGPLLVNTINKAKELGNRANELAQGDLEGGNSGNPFGEPETQCSLGIDIPEIPLIFISLGLLPIDVFLVTPGPPLTPLGMAWLPFFGWDTAPGNQLLGIPPSEKEKRRCDMVNDPNSPSPLTDSDPCVEDDV